MKKVNIVIDIARCSDCNNCFLSCKDEHWDNDNAPIAASQPRFGHRWMDILNIERGQYPLQDVAYLPKPCMHCDNAPCVKAGKDGAVYKREDGIVIIDPVKAKGQKQIVDSCPYNVIYWNEESNLPQKCTMCAHLLDNGTWKEPRCTFACPTGTLDFQLVEDDVMAARIKAENLEAYHPEFGTKPRVYYKNLYRFTKCHVAGSVELHDTKDCADGAKITLTNVATKQSIEAKTNNYGDFKIDKLEPISAQYTVKVEYPGYESKTINVDFKTSINIGTVFLNK